MVMSRETLEARARQRALDQEILPLAGTNGREYLAQSVTTEPDAHWHLWLDDNGQPHCNCPGFTHRQSCKHVERLKMHLDERRIAEEAKARREQAIAELAELFER